MTASIRETLTALCDLAGVSLERLDDDQLDIIALRVVAECGPEPSFTDLGRITDQVRFGGKVAGVGPSSVEPAPASIDVPLGQRAMDAAAAAFDEVGQRRRLTPVQRRLRLHPACIAALADGGSACDHCTVISCGDDDCSHEACIRERGWESYFA